MHEDHRLELLRNFIKKRPYLIWYVRELSQLSEEAIVEAILNYGDFNDTKKLFSILGQKRTAEIFRRQIRRKRTNYDPKILNYFNLYFQKHVGQY